jgi:hypothetical protein
LIFSFSSVIRFDNRSGTSRDFHASLIGASFAKSRRKKKLSGRFCQKIDTKGSVGPDGFNTRTRRIAGSSESMLRRAS